MVIYLTPVAISYSISCLRGLSLILGQFLDRFRFVLEVVTPGSVIKTEDWSGYCQLSEKGFPRKILSSKALNLPH